MLRHFSLAITLTACLLLVIGEFGALNEIQIGGVTRAGQDVGENHGHALLIIAIVSAVMASGAWLTRSRPAALAVVTLGVVAVFIVLAVDAPDIDTVGTIGRDYELKPDAASAAGGFKLSAAGAVLLLFGGVAGFVLAPSGAAARPSRS
jgi:hypothetical protein